MSEIADRLREAREIVCDVDVAEQPATDERLAEVRRTIADAISEVEKLEGELVRLETGGEPSGELTLAKTIRVVRDGGHGTSLEIDGAEFPWYVHEEGVAIGHIRRDDVPRVVVPIIAERVEVIDSIDTAPTSFKLRGDGAPVEQPEPEHVREPTPAPERRELEGEEPGIVRPGRD